MDKFHAQWLKRRGLTRKRAFWEFIDNDPKGVKSPQNLNFGA